MKTQQPARTDLKLRVSANHRFLEYEDGKSFFYLGDTAWMLFFNLTRDETDVYLENRARKGFTVIQAVATGMLPDSQPNRYGATPFVNDDAARPNEAFFGHVDYVVEKAAALGLFVGLLPMWGAKWHTDGRAPAFFDPQTANAYGRFLGRRYKDEPIIWILGGDHNICNDTERATIDALASGLREGDGGSHLMTFHPMGPGRSSDFFHDADWLDFNMHQSSHGARDHDNGWFTEEDYKRTPPKPTLDGENRYECLMVGFYNRGAPQYLRFDAYDVRQACYWSLLAGACGHTYGNNSIWGLWTPERPNRFDIGPTVPWHKALDHPGAFQMGIARRLFESRPFGTLAPAPSMLVDAPMTGCAKVRAARATDGSFAFVYSPRGESFAVRLDAIHSRRVRASWFDPRYGHAEFLHTSDCAGIQTFDPPSSGRGCDWVLVLEDETKNFPPAGSEALG